MADLASESPCRRGAPAPINEARSPQFAGALERPPFDEHDREIEEALAQLAQTTSSAIVCLVSPEREYRLVARHQAIRVSVPPAARLCAQALCQPGGSLLVDDMLGDTRFSDLRRDFPDFPLRTCAGLAVVSETGQHLGVLCVGDCREGPIRNADLRAIGRSTETIALLLAGRLRQAHESDRIMDELCTSAEAGRIPLVMQPIVDSISLAPVTFEALARWRRADGTPVEPENLFPLVQRYSLYATVDRAILAAACGSADGLPACVGVSVNVSGSWFRASQPGLPETVEDALLTAGLDASRLTLEVTESAVIEAPSMARSHLKSLKRLGVQLALDDFGVGYSSLSRLADYPFDMVKLDRSFLTRIGEERADSVLREVTRFVQALGLTVCAEGVETKDQFDFLRSSSRSLLQGFYIDQLSAGRRYVVGGQRIS